MRKEIIFTSGIFELDDKFKKFLRGIGYTYLSEEAREDARVIQFIKDNGTSFWGYLVYKGRESYNFKIGFAGFAYIINVDTSKQWILEYTDTDLRKVSYVKVNTSNNGMISLESTGKYDKPLKFEK